MPTPTGLPKRGDIVTMNGRKARVTRRTPGNYWSLEVVWIDPRTKMSQQHKNTTQLLVDCPFWMKQGNLKVVN